MICAPREDLDQPGHPPSLISLRRLGSSATHWAHSEDSDHAGLGLLLPIERTAKTLIRLDAQSDQSLRLLGSSDTHWAHSEDFDQAGLGPLLPIERTANTLIRLGGCPGWSEHSHFVGFVMRGDQFLWFLKRLSSEFHLFQWLFEVLLSLWR